MDVEPQIENLDRPLPDLEAAVRPEGRLRLGTVLADMSRKIGLSNADVEALDQARDNKSAEPLRFE